MPYPIGKGPGLIITRTRNTKPKQKMPVPIRMKVEMFPNWNFQFLRLSNKKTTTQSWGLKLGPSLISWPLQQVASCLTPRKSLSKKRQMIAMYFFRLAPMLIKGLRIKCSLDFTRWNKRKTMRLIQNKKQLLSHKSKSRIPPASHLPSRN